MRKLNALLGSLAGLALAVLQLSPAGAATVAAAGVTGASLQVSSLSASASQVSYSVTFRTPAALTSGKSTITIIAPSGTRLSQGDGCYTVSDDTTGPPGCGLTTIAGTRAVVTVQSTIAAGDPVTVIMADSTNPPSAGAKTLTVATSADKAPVSLRYTLTAERAVTGAAVHVSSRSAGASGTAYSVSFVSPDRLTRSSVVKVTFPAGTGMPVSGCSQTTWTDGTDGSSGCVTDSVRGTSASVSGLQANPGDVSTIFFYNVTSPPGTGKHTVTLSTTADPRPVTLAYSLVAKTAVTHPFLQLSSYKAKAAGVRWTIGFVAPDRLVNSGSDFSTTTLKIRAPAGTVFPASGCGSESFIDAGPAASQGAEDSCLYSSVSGTTLTVAAAFDTNPGNTIFLVINNVQNPSSMSSLQVSTGADPAPVTVPLGHATSMPASDQVSSTSAKATEVTYAETFASTGPLTAGTSTLTVSASGATLPACGLRGEYLEIDDTTGTQAAMACGPNGGTAGHTMTLTDALDTRAGDEISVLAYGVSNPSASGSTSFGLVTKPGAGHAALSVRIGSEAAPGPVRLTLSSTSASAGVTALSATFTVPDGFMVSGFGEEFSTIGVKAPAGTRFLKQGYALVLNDSTGGAGGAVYDGSGATATVVPGSGGFDGAGPGDEISVIVWGATNPAAAGKVSASVSTTSDPGAVTARYTLTRPTAVRDDLLQVSSHTGHASGVTYTQTFIAGNGLITTTDSNSTITVTLPAGTGMPAGGTGNVNVTDDTTGTDCGGSATVTGTAAVITLTTGACPGELAAGDVDTVSISGIKNSASPAGKTVRLVTSADPAAVTSKIP
jgi:hypothetical protein